MAAGKNDANGITVGKGSGKEGAAPAKKGKGMVVGRQVTSSTPVLELGNCER